MTCTRSLLAILFGVFAASGLSAQKYPPPFPRDGIVKVFENERVIVWKGIAGFKSRPTVMHEHTLDFAGVFLDDGGIPKITLPDGSVRVATTPTSRGITTAGTKGTIHIEEQLKDGIRVVVIELKDGKPAASDSAAALPTSFPRAGATLERETDRLSIWEYQWLPSRRVPLHLQNRDAVIVPLESGNVRFTPDKGQPRSVTLTFGDPLFIARGESFSEEATEGTPEAIVIELK